MPKLRSVIKDNQLQEVPDSEIEYEHLSPNQHLGTHANLVPLQSAVSSGRVFYGARFANQALPVNQREAPLVQLLSDTDPAGRAFDEILGNEAGNVRATHEGTVHKVEPDQITVKAKDGSEVVHDLYSHFGFNRKTQIHNTPLVKEGDSITPGQLLAHSNYTDKHGTLALGTNARIGLVPYKGHSMDDAIVISNSMAKRLTANNLYGHDLEYKRGVRGGKAHYTGLFTHKYVNAQLDKLDDDGVVKKGQILQQGDPIILATKPRIVSSASAQLGQLSKHMKNARGDASVLWDHETPGTVLDVTRTRSGVKVNVSSDSPAEVGNKICMRSGAKAVISTIIPDEHMPRTADGKPLEILLNPQSLVSRMNPSLAYEIMLGKVARKTGKNYKLPSVLPKGMPWYDFVKGELDKNGLKDREEVFDPQMNRKLENPITVGDAHVLVLHHTSPSKLSSRGTGGYNSDLQPQHGGGENAQCFAPKQTINTSEGPLPIARICEKRLRVHVKSWHEQMQEWVYRPVTDWFVRRASVSDLLTIKYVTNCDRHKSTDTYHKTYNHAALMVTKNHQIYTPDGLKPAQDLRVGSELLTWGPLITDDQKQLLIGSMLGDAYAHIDFDAIRIEHGQVQRPYALWKQRILSGLGAYHFNTDRVASKSSVVRKLTKKTAIKAVAVQLGLPYVTKWARRFFYSNGKKTVTKEWIGQLTKFGFAVLMLDDGSVSYSTEKNRFYWSLATMSFNQEELLLLQKWIFDNVGVDVHIHANHTLATTKREDVFKLMDVVAEWVPWDVIPKSKAATIKHCKRVQETQPCRVLDIQNKLGRVPVEITSIDPYTHDKPDIDEINVYDFSVHETHNYCASGVSVSNSKRMSGLESNALLSSGAYNILREGATLRGTRSDQYWRELRQGYEPKEPGTPFIWEKFKALLQGAGYHARKMGNGNERLQFLTEKDLDKHRPLPVKSGDIVDMKDLTPIKGGLFSPELTGSNSWGFVQLPGKYPTPAAQDVICKLLGLTERQFRSILAGEEDMPVDTEPRAVQRSRKA